MVLIEKRGTPSFRAQALEMCSLSHPAMVEKEPGCPFLEPSRRTKREFFRKEDIPKHLSTESLKRENILYRNSEMLVDRNVRLHYWDKPMFHKFLYHEI